MYSAKHDEHNGYSFKLLIESNNTIFKLSHSLFKSKNCFSVISLIVISKIFNDFKGVRVYISKINRDAVTGFSGHRLLQFLNHLVGI